MDRKHIEKQAKKQLKGFVPCEWNVQPFIDIFVMASEWRITSVWHEASVEPTKKKMLIVLDKSGYMFECDVLVDPIPDTTWEEFVKDVVVVKWCYKEDLLPNK